MKTHLLLESSRRMRRKKTDEMGFAEMSKA